VIVFLLVAGWLAQRFGVHYVLPGGLALWATATALTGLAASFTLLRALRALLAGQPLWRVLRPRVPRARYAG
jgi:MFS family permease